MSCSRSCAPVFFAIGWLSPFVGGECFAPPSSDGSLKCFKWGHPDSVAKFLKNMVRSTLRDRAKMQNVPPPGFYDKIFEKHSVRRHVLGRISLIFYGPQVQDVVPLEPVSNLKYLSSCESYAWTKFEHGGSMCSNLESPETPANRHRDGCEALSFFYLFSFFVLSVKLRSQSIFLHHFAYLRCL